MFRRKPLTKGGKKAAIKIRKSHDKLDNLRQSQLPDISRNRGLCKTLHVNSAVLQQQLTLKSHMMFADAFAVALCQSVFTPMLDFILKKQSCVPPYV